FPCSVPPALPPVREFPNGAGRVHVHPRPATDRDARRLRRAHHVMELGLLPALGSGIGELERVGQASRLIEGYFEPYARAFSRVWYFSYLPEALTDFTENRDLAETVRVVGPRAHPQRFVRAVEMAVRHREQLRRCAVLRSFQLTGIIPALVAHARWGTPF